MFLELDAQFGRVDDVAVVREGDVATLREPTTTGCAFSIVDEPDVLYRVCPTAVTPCSLASSVASASESVPMFRAARALPAGSIDTTPTDS